MSSTRLRIQIERTNATTWEVRYPGIAELQARTLTLSPNLITLPQTTGFNSNNPKDRDLAINIMGLKSPGTGDMVRFGSYLFDVLVGSAWNTITAAGLPEMIELDSSDPEFHRLPWEMAYGPTDFLAKLNVGMIRVIPSAGGPQKITISPKVLFVIGADLSDKRIRPGAEYLGMLKRLEASDLFLKRTCSCAQRARAWRVPFHESALPSLFSSLTAASPVKATANWSSCPTMAAENPIT